MGRIVVSHQSDRSGRCVLFRASLFMSFMRRVTRVHVAGLKSYGVFLANPLLGDDEDAPSEAHFFDPSNNRRNDGANRLAFEAQGAYFRRHHDAGFVVDGGEVLALQHRAHRTGEETVALFHTHRRQPANFSIIDYRLHNPLFRWHLVVSMRDPRHPRLQPFWVDKPLYGHGISEHDRVEGEGETGYRGPEVKPILLLVEGTPAQLAGVEQVLSDNPFLRHHPGQAIEVPEPAAAA